MGRTLGRWAAVVAAALVLIFSGCTSSSGSGLSRDRDKERSSHSKSSSHGSGSGSHSSGSSSGTIDWGDDSDEADAPPAPTITVTVVPRDAQILVAGRPMGRGSVQFSSLGFGQKVVVEAQAPRYHSRQLVLRMWNQTEEYQLTLDPIVGIVKVDLSQAPGAQVSVEGVGLSEGPNSVIVGPHQVLARKFGFKDKTWPISLAEDQVVDLAVSLDPAPFTFSGLKSNRPWGFNPDSSGSGGQATLTFQASAPGTATLRILDSKKNEVFRKDLGHLDTWDHEVTWDGTRDGAALADGRYTVVVEGTSDEGVPAPVLKTRVKIDRSTIDRDRVSLGPTSGLLWTPTAEVLGPSSSQISTLFLAHSSDTVTHTPLSTTLRFSPTPGWEVSTSTTFQLWDDPTLASADTTLAVKQAIDLDVTNLRAAWAAGLTLGSFLDGTDFVVPSTDLVTTYPSVWAAIPLQFTWGPWSLVATPEVNASTFSPASAFEPGASAAQGTTYWGYARGGLSYDPGPFSVAVSAAQRTKAWGFGIGWSGPLHLGAEARYTFPETPLTLSGYASVSAYSTEIWDAYAGVGLSLLLPPALDLASLSSK